MGRLLTRPILSPEAEPYWDAFAYLERDRDTVSHSMGMGGGLLLAVRLKRDAIRREGRRRLYRGGDLDTFVEILAAYDDLRVERVNRQAADDLKAAVERSRRGKRR